MPELDRTTLLDLWRRMVRIRRFEERVHTETEDGRTEGYTHTAHGEEATAVGVIALLREDDWFTSTYRNHHHGIARDIPLEAIAGELLGKVTGVCGGKGGSMHAADQDAGMIGGMGIVAAGLPIAAGAAFAARRLGQDRVAVSFFGDGAVHQGAWHEALDFAALLSCPVIFVCENNLYAETTAIDYHLNATSVAAMAAPYGIPAVQVDGMDVFAVRRATETAIARARAGGGPSLIEAMTYRYGGQYEGDTQRYKPPWEQEHWRAKDPLDFFRRAVASRVEANELDAIDAAARRSVDDAWSAAEAADWPSPETLTQDVYASWPEGAR
ncbi:thiamine pyrophosphate-dependent dehydrogenase E1 component subunit alpha [soil metagenome]